MLRNVTGTFALFCSIMSKSWRRRVEDCVEVNGKLHYLTVLLLGKQSLVPLEWGAWWVRESVRTFRR